MRIAAVRTYLTFGGWRNWVFVQVETDEDPNQWCPVLRRGWR